MDREDLLIRWKALKEELVAVFEQWIERNNNLPDLWMTWLLQMCTVGNVLQLVCAALLVIDGVIDEEKENTHYLLEGITLLLSLMLMLHLQVRYPRSIFFRHVLHVFVPCSFLAFTFFLRFSPLAHACAESGHQTEKHSSQLSRQ
jgi:hypothetical protein